MRRLPFAAAVLACGALLAGCGASHVNHTRPYAVQVYLCSPEFCAANATPREERLVGEHLLHEPCVQGVVFTSKAEAWARVKKEDPTLPMPSQNPLPDSFEVTPDKLSCTAAIAASARAARWGGVQKIELERRLIPAGS